jgi:hypothetical protein
MDVYSEPKNYKLEIVESLDDLRAFYEFNMIVVWKHEDGRLFWDQDSGCSCHSPFEDYNDVKDLNILTNKTFTEFEKAVKDHPADGPDKIELFAKVKELLK